MFLHQLQTDVLIVGGGPAGLTAAVALSTYGIAVILVTKQRWISTTPRAHVTNPRTFEVLRDLGLEEEAMAQATPYTQLTSIVFCTSLGGEELARNWNFSASPMRHSDYALSSPCQMSDLAQNLLEPILLKHAIARGTQVRFNTEYLSSLQDADGVTAQVHDRQLDETFEIRAKYMIGADGGRSRVAEVLNLPMEGRMNLGASANIQFDCDLTRYVAHRPALLYFMVGDGSAGEVELGILRPTRRWDQWMLIKGYEEGTERSAITDEDAIAAIRGYVGDPSLTINIRGIDLWDLNSAYATRFTVGRIFGVGDAIHRHPPSNGLGSNTSVQDSYNLAWKLALVLQGKAEPSLLDSYDEERVPVGKQIVERATASLRSYPPLLEAFGLLVPPSSREGVYHLAARKAASEEGRHQREAIRRALKAKNYEFNAHGVQMNQHYVSCAVVSEGARRWPADVDPELYYSPTTAPGARLPHAWLQRKQVSISTLDLVGRGRFTVLSGIGGECWGYAAVEASAHFGVPVEMCAIGPGCEITDNYSDWDALREIEESGCLLVRPDGHVAWRAHQAPASEEKASFLLKQALRQILGRS